jgi:hypothetical protein
VVFESLEEGEEEEEGVTRDPQTCAAVWLTTAATRADAAVSETKAEIHDGDKDGEAIVFRLVMFDTRWNEDTEECREVSVCELLVLETIEFVEVETTNSTLCEGSNP